MVFNHGWPSRQVVFNSHCILYLWGFSLSMTQNLPNFHPSMILASLFLYGGVCWNLYQHLYDADAVSLASIDKLESSISLKVLVIVDQSECIKLRHEENEQMLHRHTLGQTQTPNLGPSSCEVTPCYPLNPPCCSVLDFQSVKLQFWAAPCTGSVLSAIKTRKAPKTCLKS